MSQLRYIKYDDIDFLKWERTIAEAANSRIYANEWHLGRTAANWDAIVYGDYEYVMPVPVRSKMGIRYAYQPLYSQQLGIFPSPETDLAKKFYRFLYQNFWYADLYLNSQCRPVEENNLVFTPRQNYLLSLQQSYEEISAKYSKNTRRNLAKAMQQNLHLMTGIRLEEYMEFKTLNPVPGVKKETVQNLKSLIAYGQFKGTGEIYGVYSSQNELCAAAYLCRWKERVVFLNAASNEKGKDMGAMALLINRFIEENAESQLVLDFEGSVIPGVARFYAGFGATPETYFQLKFNRLPLPLKWFKR